MAKKELGMSGTIGRFRPLHNGGALLLETICEKSDHVIIGIGSSNRYDARNPFTPEETRDMIERYLSPRHSNYEIKFIPDSGHQKEHSDGMMWVDNIKKEFGTLNYFISGNAYVKSLLKNHYTIIRPVEIIPKDKWINVSGTVLRIAMAQGDGYKSMVPEQVSRYIAEHKLVERFRREFGHETLSRMPVEEYLLGGNAEQEKKKVLGA